MENLPTDEGLPSRPSEQNETVEPTNSELASNTNNSTENGTPITSTNGRVDTNNTKTTEEIASTKRCDYSIHEGFQERGRIMTHFFQYCEKDLMFDKAIEFLKCDKTFREIFSECILDTHYFPNVALELPPVAATDIHLTRFELSLIHTDQVDRDGNKYDQEIKNPDDVLLLMTPQDDGQYDSIGSFVRDARPEVLHHFLKISTVTFESELNKDTGRPLWMSSAVFDRKFHLALHDRAPSNYQNPSYMSYTKKEQLKSTGMSKLQV